MKKLIYVFSLITLAFSVSFCDMNKLPEGTLDDETALQSLNDCERFRNNLYLNLKGLTNGANVYLTDLQADEFQGTVINGNRSGIIHAGSFSSKDGEFEGLWGSCYSVISSVNYYLEKVDALIEKGAFDEAELVQINRFIAEAKFVRAYCYYMLTDRFCEPYSAENATAANKGVPVVKQYHPTGDNTKYPARGTQQAVYDFINEDLNDALTGLQAFEVKDKSNVAPNAPYLNSYAVYALQARIALNKGEKKVALELAEKVIKSGFFRLAKLDEVQKMWLNDEADELIFRPFKSKEELGGSIGITYQGVKKDAADYIPASETMALFDEGDARFPIYFTKFNLIVEGEPVPAFVFQKFPGNPDLQITSEPNYQNMSKPFRLSELYLIAAEACAESDSDLANKYLKDLRVNRIKGYNAESTYKGAALISEIRLERQRELLGEGFRLTDLRRWGLGFTRGTKHPENTDVENIIMPNGKGLKYQPGDHRYTWPIPSAEIQANPQMKGQQNPGY